MKSPLSVGSVPAVGASFGFIARAPAMAMTGTR